MTGTEYINKQMQRQAKMEGMKENLQRADQIWNAHPEKGFEGKYQIRNEACESYVRWSKWSVYIYRAF